MSGRHDFHSCLYPAVGTAPKVASASENGDTTDLIDFGSATAVLNLGVGGITFSAANRLEFVLQHSDDGSAWSNCTLEDALGVDDTLITGNAITDGIVLAFKALHDAAAAYKIGYVGGKRYVRLNPKFSGTHGTGTPIGIVWERSNAAFSRNTVAA